jgi:hypothetical protein
MSGDLVLYLLTGAGVAAIFAKLAFAALGITRSLDGDSHER